MSTLLFTLGFFLLMALGMAVGVLRGRGRTGQGYGMSAMSGEDCLICGGPGSCDAGDGARGNWLRRDARAR
jgi:hypothetical protein